MTLAQISRNADLPWTTAHRLVSELAEWGALERTEDGMYTIGLRMWELGALSQRGLPLRAVAMPFMNDLYEATRQHVQLAVLDGDAAVIIERISAPGAVGLISQAGGRLPLHASAVGKVLLAHSGPEVLERACVAGMRRYTPHTIATEKELRAELAECRRTGVAAVREELTLGVHSVATGIFGMDGQVAGALSIVIQRGSINTQTLVPAVATAGHGISRSLERSGAHGERPRAGDAEVSDREG